MDAQTFEYLARRYMEDEGLAVTRSIPISTSDPDAPVTYEITKDGKN